MAKSKKSQADMEDEQLLDAAIAKNKAVERSSSGSFVSSAEALLVAVSALFTACIPVYMFCSALFGMNIADDAVVFLAGIATTTFLLFKSTEACAAVKLDAINAERGVAGASDAEAAEEGAKRSNEAVMYAMAVQNAIFLGGFYFFSFYLLKGFAADYPTVVYAAGTLATPLLQLAHAQGHI